MEATAAVDSFRHELITPRGGVSHADPSFLCLPCDRCLFGQSKRLQVLHQRFYNSSISAARGRLLCLSVVVPKQPRLNVKILLQNFSGVPDGGDTSREPLSGYAPYSWCNIIGCQPPQD